MNEMRFEMLPGEAYHATGSQRESRRRLVMVLSRDDARIELVFLDNLAVCRACMDERFGEFCQVREGAETWNVSAGSVATETVPGDALDCIWRVCHEG